MGILNWDKPAKLKNADTHNKKHSSDSGVAGTYVPNMSKEDMNKWKAKYIKGADERIEIRKSILGTQLLIVVKKEGGFIDKYRKFGNVTVKMSMNGPLFMSDDILTELQLAVSEAKEILTDVVIEKAKSEYTFDDFNLLPETFLTNIVDKEYIEHGDAFDNKEAWYYANIEWVTSIIGYKK